MALLRLLMLSLLGLLLALPGRAADIRPDCDSCRIEVKSLDKPVKLTGKWLFTREDRPENKEPSLDTRDWKLIQAPGPWKHAYNDGKVFTVGWYRGTLHFDPSLVGEEVVFMVNTYMARMHVFVDGQEVYQRPHDINIERYYSIQPIPVRFKVTKPDQVVSFRVESPLMTGVYELPFEVHRYNQHDTSLALWQFWGGEARTIAAYVMFVFGLFFLLVYSKTQYPLYLTAALAGLLIFPFFGSPGDYFMKVFSPEVMLYSHYTGLMGIFMFYMFGQYITHRFLPRLNWVKGAVYLVLCGIIGSMMVVPNVELFQKVRPVLFILNLISGSICLWQLVRAWREGKSGAAILSVAMIIFLGTGLNDVLLALGKISSVSLIFTGVLIYMCAMMYVASTRFANTFMENRQLVKDLQVVNDNLEGLVNERTEQLREKTQDIQSMLENMPQGVLTVTGHNQVHTEYSAYLETILETQDIAGRDLMALLFSDTNLGADVLSSVETAAGACIGEDVMNFEFNSHLMVTEFDKTMPDGRVKSLALSWSPICDELSVVDKLMICVRDVTELKRLEHEASEQKRELDIIGQILRVTQEKFSEFIEGARQFIAENRQLIEQAQGKDLDVVGLLFRNMHTIKGNARTYGLLNLTNVVHEAEQAYDQLRKDLDAAWDPMALLQALDQVHELVEEYARINDHVLGRKGPGRRGSVEKYAMVDRDDLGHSLQLLSAVNMDDPVALRSTLKQLKLTLSQIGTERLEDVLAGQIESLDSLARELGKEPPVVRVDDHHVVVQNQIAPLLKNLFTHLLRNAMDHGLEPAAERLAAGKPAAGRIQIEMSLDAAGLHLRLRDDGRGLAIGRIRQRALEQGLLTPEQMASPDTVAETIFLSGFSTAEQVTEVSGRGVGMDAVRGFLQREGGDIHIRFLDQQEEADYRAFELAVHLPARFGVQLEMTGDVPVGQSLAAPAA
ncbi:MAG TPA: ATP-binding protein [Aquabacterium sp.]|nr:ATP-binding protein [Aquabacterium sp.]